MGTLAGSFRGFVTQIEAYRYFAEEFTQSQRRN